MLNAIDTGKLANETFYGTTSDARKDLMQCTIVGVSKLLVLEPHSITASMTTKRALGLLYFDPDYEISIQGCLPGKGIVQVLLNHPFYILATDSLMRPQKVDKNKVLERLKDDIYMIINTNSLTFKNITSPKSIFITVVTNQQSSI